MEKLLLVEDADGDDDDVGSHCGKGPPRPKDEGHSQEHRNSGTIHRVAHDAIEARRDHLLALDDLHTTREPAVFAHNLGVEHIAEDEE